MSQFEQNELKQPEDLFVDQERVAKLFKQALNKYPVIGIFLGTTGYKKKLEENIPKVVSILSRDPEGREVLKDMGIYEILFKQD